MSPRAFIILYVLCLLLLAVLPAGAGRQFTNESLEKYQSAPSSAAADEDAGTRTEEAVQYNVPPAERPLRRYVIPYSGGGRRIIIPVTFNRRVTASMLLDTGAPGMHISKELAEKLGLLESSENNLWIMIGGIGGATPAIFTIIDSIQVGEAEDAFVPTYISPKISGQFDGLIGMDFMANYSMRLDPNKRVVIFEEIPQNSDMPAGHDETWWRTTFQNFRSIRQVWEGYRERLLRKKSFTDREKQIEAFVQRQCDRANDLYNKLLVHASKHSVPREWR